MQAYCLAAASAGAADSGVACAGSLMWHFLTTPGDGLLPLRLLDAGSGTSLARGGIDLQAVCTVDSDLRRGELPLEDADGEIVAKLVISISVCTAFLELMRRLS
jgi:hypothetical protein